MATIRTNQYQVYFDNKILVGTASIDLPSLTPASSEISGAGIAGTINIPARGHFGSMPIVLHWRNVNRDALKTLGLGEHTLEARGAIEAIDDSTRRPYIIQQSIFCSVLTTEISFGSYAPNAEAGGTSSYEAVSIIIEEDGKTVFELDKLNMICKTLKSDGSLEDILQPVRDAIN